MTDTLDALSPRSMPGVFCCADTSAEVFRRRHPCADNTRKCLTVTLTKGLYRLALELAQSDCENRSRGRAALFVRRHRQRRVTLTDLCIYTIKHSDDLRATLANGGRGMRSARSGCGQSNSWRRRSAPASVSPSSSLRRRCFMHAQLELINGKMLLARLSELAKRPAEPRQ